MKKEPKTTNSIGCKMKDTPQNIANNLIQSWKKDSGRLPTTYKEFGYSLDELYGLCIDAKCKDSYDLAEKAFISLLPKENMKAIKKDEKRLWN